MRYEDLRRQYESDMRKMIDLKLQCAEAVSRASLPKKNVFSAERCLRKSDTDFDRWSAG